MKNSRKKRLLLWAGGAVLFFGVLCFGLIQYRVYSLSAPYRVAEEEAPEAQAIVILGAKVEEDGTLSPALEDRLAQGLALYRAGKAPRLLVSGDGENQTRNEVEAMKSYLLDQNVPQEAILEDPHGLNTYASLYRAKHVYQLETLLVVTQDYHLGRALYLGQQLGLSCEGVGTPNSVLKAQLPQNLLRESLARVKAFFNAEVLPPDPAPLLAPGA